MKTVIAWMVIVALSGQCIPACVLAESVFSGSREEPPRLRLEPTVGERGFGAAGSAALGGSSLSTAEGSALSPLKAGSLSFLLPGLGERRLGHSLRSKIFFGLEAAGWISIASFLWIGHSREHAYRDYAVTFAGVAGTDHSDDYYKTIGQYMSSDGPGGYNEVVRREARDFYYPDVDAMDSYYRSHAIAGEEAWSWRDEAAYLHYGDLHSGSRFANRVALYSAIGLVALRVVSAADAARAAKVDGGTAADAGATSMGLEAAPRSLALFVRRSF